MLPPFVWPGDWTEEDFRAIAGFILYYRAGVLRALESTSDPAYDQIPVTKAGQLRYYRDAEAFTRFLLYNTPYPVQKDELWNPDEQYYPQYNGPLGGPG